MKTAIIGCGQIADVHIAEIRKLTNVELVAVCDRHALMAEQAAVRFGVPRFYTDVQHLLTEVKPDVVHITTPPSSHLPLAQTVLTHGAHAYIEKPFAVNAIEAQALEALSNKTGKLICVGHNLSLDAAILQAKELWRTGALGELVHISSVVSYDLKGAFGRLLLENPKHWVHDLPGHLFQNVAPHAIYLATDFLGDARPHIVSAHGYHLRSQRFGDRRDAFHDEWRVLLRGKGCTADIVFSCHLRPVMQYLRLFGTKATVHVDLQARSVSFELMSSLPGALGRLAAPVSRTRQQLRHSWQNLRRFVQSDLHYNDGMFRLFEAFYGAIRQGRSSPIPPSEGVRVTQVLDDILAQSSSIAP